MSLALIDWSTSTIVCKCASYTAQPCQPPISANFSVRIGQHRVHTYLRSVRTIIDRRLETSSKGTLGIASTEELSDLPRNPSDVRLRDLRLCRVKRGHVKVDRRVLGEGVDVDDAPVVAEGGARVLLDDRHGDGILGPQTRV